MAKEGVPDDLHVEWYGGEISLLGVDYLGHSMRTVKAILPKSSHSVVSNLINVDDKWLEVVYKNCTHLCTSYEGIRFDDNDDLYRAWESNIKKVMKYLPVDCITVATPRLNQAFKVINRFSFRYITVLRMMAPEDMSAEKRERILRYATSIDEYVQLCRKAISLFGSNRVTQAIHAETSIANVLHIFPDGNVGLPGPSELGYPYESNNIFYRHNNGKNRNRDATILKSRERIKFIAAQLLMCQNDCADKTCLAEFKYPNLCVGYLNS
jgi:hypothetical protein